MSNWKKLKDFLPELGQLMIDDPENGYEQIERRTLLNGEPAEIGGWNHVLCQANAFEYRIKANTVTRTVTYPAPLQERPKNGETYWTIDSPSSHMAAHFLTWWGQQVDERAFNRGMCFATREDARAAHAALFGGE